MIGIAIGDVTGVGLEVTLKAISLELASNSQRYLLIGDFGYIERWNAQLAEPLSLSRYSQENQEKGRVMVLDPAGDPLPSGLLPGSPAAAQAAVRYLHEGARLCLKHEMDALVTAPVNKESIIRAGIPFVGQTELLSGLAGTSRATMMLLGHDDRGRWLRVALATTHVPLRLVSSQLTKEKILLAIERAAKACQDLGLARSRVAVCGLNPHAGEGGEMGTEEVDLINETVRESKAKGFDVEGPFAADSLFHQVYRGDFEAVVAMYHDQGLIPLKMVAFETGVNWTLGLPFTRTSPDHGTAYNIAGKNLANPSSMVEAIRLAQKLAENARRGPLMFEKGCEVKVENEVEAGGKSGDIDNALKHLFRKPAVDRDP